MMDLFIPVPLLFWSFSQMFIFSELGERLSDRFNQLDTAIIYCDWYTFPLKLRKSLPMILEGTQKPIRLRGYGNVPCTRETFKNVRGTQLKFMNFGFDNENKMALL